MLISIGRALSQERDIQSLLAIILRRACEVTNADAGSVYVVEGDDEDVAQRTLRFAVSQNDSRTLPPAGFTMPVSSTSIVGQCVLSGDASTSPTSTRSTSPGTGNNPWGFVHDRSFDDKYRYQTRSVLAVPMISARAEVIGVIQLINKRAKGWITARPAERLRERVVPFDDVSEAYVFALASQAGIALENALLYDEVKTLFDGFVKAAVTAIESRDPTTSGHSERVAELTVGLAQAVNRADSGPLPRRPVLARRPHADRVRGAAPRLRQGRRARARAGQGEEAVRARARADPAALRAHQARLQDRGPRVEGAVPDRGIARAGRRASSPTRRSRHRSRKIAELDDIIKFILQANEPTVLEQGGFERIADDRGHDVHRRPTAPSAAVPHATTRRAALQITRGSLTEQERLEINSHVVHTTTSCAQIPWGRTLRDVPEIAGAHHEKLDGTGYPQRPRAATQIPVPARMMTIADIYDALTASDRPYKKAMPVEKALDILGSEVKRGQLDAELFDVFVERAGLGSSTQRDRSRTALRRAGRSTRPSRCPPALTTRLRRRASAAWCRPRRRTEGRTDFEVALRLTTDAEIHDAQPRLPREGQADRRARVRAARGPGRRAPSRRARRHRDLRRHREAPGQGAASRPGPSCCTSPRTASAICSATTTTTTPRRPR